MKNTRNFSMLSNELFEPVNAVKIFVLQLLLLVNFAPSFLNHGK
jgi:hypothetical protein